MSSQEILVRELESTGRTIEWAISCVPEDRLLTEPPHGNHPKSGQGFRTFFGRRVDFNLAVIRIAVFIRCPFPQLDDTC